MASQPDSNPQTSSARKRRVRGKVQPPKLRQSATYWDELSERCLQDYVVPSEPETAIGEAASPEPSALR